MVINCESHARIPTASLFSVSLMANFCTNLDFGCVRRPYFLKRDDDEGYD